MIINNKKIYRESLTLLDQLIAAFGDLLIGLFSVFQTIWISDCDRGY